MRRAASRDYSGSAQRFGGTQDCAHVARILYTHEHEDKRIGAAHEGFKGEFARAQQSGDPLGSFCGCDRGKKLVGRAQNQRGAVEFRMERTEMAFSGIAGENGFDFESGANRLQNEARSFEPDESSFGARGMENSAEGFQPVIFARGNSRALRTARSRGFG